MAETILETLIEAFIMISSPILLPFPETRSPP
jgi:hypothetical protein